MKRAPFASVHAILPAVALVGWLAALPANAAPAGIEVLVKDNFFEPAHLSVHAGERIVFHNTGKQLHALSLLDHEDVLDEVYLEPGERYTFTVPAALGAGRYRLVCTIHLGMEAGLEVRP